MKKNQIKKIKKILIFNCKHEIIFKQIKQNKSNKLRKINMNKK